jgi:hypothetical protein
MSLLFDLTRAIPWSQFASDKSKFLCRGCNLLAPTTFALYDADSWWAAAIFCTACETLRSSCWICKDACPCDGYTALNQHSKGKRHKKAALAFLSANRPSLPLEDNVTNPAPGYASAANAQAVDNNDMENHLEDCVEGDDPMLEDISPIYRDHDDLLDDALQEVFENEDTTFDNGAISAGAFQHLEDRCSGPKDFYHAFPNIQECMYF